MCGRFVAASSVDDLVAGFSVREVRLTEIEPSWNVAPTDPTPVVLAHESVRSLEVRRWGLVPHWAQSPTDAAKRINARAETVHETPAFRDAFARKRCIVPVDGFYEWRRQPNSPSQPYFIRSRDSMPLALAGLRATWGEGEKLLQTCAVITTAANSVMGEIHDRMPVILAEDAWDGWLDDQEDDQGWLRSLLVAADDELLEMVAVSRAVNNVRNDGPALIEQVPDAVQHQFNF